MSSSHYKKLPFPERKLVRANALRKHIEAAGYAGAVCFSCGHASRALVDAGVYTVDVSATGALSAKRWWSAAEIHRAWPNLLDATSGHLPVPLLGLLGAAYKAHLGSLRAGPWCVPTGSGETIIALQLAYPGTKFVAEYGGARATRYESRAPMNALVRAMFEVRHR